MSRNVTRHLGPHAKEFWLYTLVIGTLKVVSDLIAAASGNRLFHWQATKCLFLTFLWNPVLPEGCLLCSSSTLSDTSMSKLPIRQLSSLISYLWDQTRLRIQNIFGFQKDNIFHIFCNKVKTKLALHTLFLWVFRWPHTTLLSLLVSSYWGKSIPVGNHDFLPKCPAFSTLTSHYSPKCAGTSRPTHKPCPCTMPVLTR